MTHSKTKVVSFSVVLAASVFLSSASVSASSGAHSGPPASLDTLIWPAVNFSLFCLLLVFCYRRFALPILLNYRIELESVAVREESENSVLTRELEDIRRQLEGISEEKQRIVEEFEGDGVQAASAIVADAHVRADKMLKDVDRRYVAEKQRVFTSVQAHLWEKTMSEARNRLQGSISSELDQRLMIADLERGIPALFDQGK